MPKPTTLISDFSKVLLFPKDSTHPDFKGSLNVFHRKLKKNLGSDYQILDYFVLNQELLNFYKQLMARNITVVMYTSETIQEDLGLRPALAPVFSSNRMISAQKLGIKNNDPAGYEILLKKLKCKPQETIFIDDSKKNIAAASKIGITTVQYFSNKLAIKDLQTAILENAV